MLDDAVREFFSTAVERESIRRRKEAGLSFPWTKDKIFQEWQFCNVHRENDKTTVWFRENVRSKLKGIPLINSTFIFRWFNRIETGEKILDLLLEGWNTEEARKRLTGVKPLITGAYMQISYPPRMSMLDAILFLIDKSLPIIKMDYITWGSSLRNAFQDLRKLPYHGPFKSYEMVTDLRHTHILEEAQDINTWANLGPGSTLGIQRLTGKTFDRAKQQDEMLEFLQELLDLSTIVWPADFQPWEMRETEHWTCEYNKYCNGKEGKRLKRKYKSPEQIITEEIKFEKHPLDCSCITCFLGV